MPLSEVYVKNGLALVGIYKEHTWMNGYFSGKHCFYLFRVGMAIYLFTSLKPCLEQGILGMRGYYFMAGLTLLITHLLLAGSKDVIQLFYLCQTVTNLCWETEEGKMIMMSMDKTSLKIIKAMIISYIPYPMLLTIISIVKFIFYNDPSPAFPLWTPDMNIAFIWIFQFTLTFFPNAIMVTYFMALITLDLYICGSVNYLRKLLEHRPIKPPRSYDKNVINLHQEIIR